MHQVAEAGVAAHWLYKEQAEEVSPLQQKAHEWMQSLLAVQTTEPREFLDHLKIDLFPDVVYVFTPKGAIKELPRGSTPVDFAYTVHTDVGNRCVGALINGQSKPLDVELRNGDVVKIETRADSIPHPGWLGFVKTAKARAEIRHVLKTTTQERAISFGRRLLEHAVKGLGAKGLDDPLLQWDMVWHEMPANDRESLYASIGLGHSLANVVARRLISNNSEAPATRRERKLSPFAERALRLAAEHLTHQETGITLNGSEGTAVQYAHCCYPIAGDNACGHMRGGTGLMVHRASCATAKRQRAKEPQRWADILWGEPMHRTFESHLVVDVTDSPGVLALVAAAISTANGNILDLRIERQGTGFPSMHIAIEVKDRQHLAEVLRKIRKTSAVTKASRATRVGG
jgi:GTP pyrophosphokinase